MWLVDNRQDVCQSRSLIRVDCEHFADKVDELRTVAEFSHEVELLSDLVAVEGQVLHIVEVSKGVVAGAAQTSDTKGENLVLFGMYVLQSPV